MKIIKVLILISFLFFGCKKENKQEHSDIVVNLEIRGGSSPIGTWVRAFRFLGTIPDEFKGVVEKDSSFIGYLPVINKDSLDSLLSKGLITEDEYDSTKINIYILSGYKEGEQFYILDKNNNKDFGDDKVVKFPKSLKYMTKGNQKIIDSIPTFKMYVNRIDNNNLYRDKIFIGVYPDAKYYNYNIHAKTPTERLLRELLVVAKVNSYLYGNFSSENHDYKIAVNNSWMQPPKFLFRKRDSTFFTHNSPKRQEYQLKDTLKLGKSYYRISDFSNISRNTILEKLELEDGYKGFMKGDIVKNQKIEGLDGKIFDFKGLIAGKELLLIDFWGTWCAPCKELTPGLVGLHKKHEAKVNFVSLAFQEDPKQVRNYTIKNNMAWFNGIIKGTPKLRQNKPKIITDLRIEAFPTFILLDPDLKIVFRGNGAHFKKMTSFLEKYLSD